MDEIALTISKILVGCSIFLVGFLTGIFAVLRIMRGVFYDGDEE